jgi:hypothetical protein
MPRLSEWWDFEVGVESEASLIFFLKNSKADPYREGLSVKPDFDGGENTIPHHRLEISDPSASGHRCPFVKGINTLNGQRKNALREVLLH